jgi:hypothetical protein
LIVTDRPTREFGKRKPAIPTVQPVKRSNHVALLLMGSFAVGGGAYALMPGGNCAPSERGMASGVPNTAACQPRASSSYGGHGGSGGSSWRSGFYGGDSSSGRASSGGSSESGSGGVTRGGFGSFAGIFSGGS